MDLFKTEIMTLVMKKRATVEMAQDEHNTAYYDVINPPPVG